jgi:hypothetical protein
MMAAVAGVLLSLACNSTNAPLVTTSGDAA